MCLLCRFPCGAVADPGIKFGRGTWRAWEREPITEVWGRSTQRGPGAEPLVGGQGRRHFYILDVLWKRQHYGFGGARAPPHAGRGMDPPADPRPRGSANAARGSVVDGIPKYSNIYTTL